MSRSRESRPRGSRKQQTKITYAARARTLNRLKKIIMGHRDSLSQLILSSFYSTKQGRSLVDSWSRGLD